MEARIEAAHGTVDVLSNDDELAFSVAGRDIRITWADVTGAGLARLPALPTQLPRAETEILPGQPRPMDVVPFGNRLVDLTRRLGADHRALVIAYGSDSRGFQVFLPRDDAGSLQLRDELSTRLGGRWLGDEWELGELRCRLGVRVGWRGRTLGALFVVVVGVGGFLAVAGWAGIVAAVREEDFSLLRPYTLVPLALWLLLVWYLLRRFRRG